MTPEKLPTYSQSIPGQSPISLTLVGERLVLRDGEGRLVHRYSGHETADIFALVNALDEQEAAGYACFTPDGSVSADLGGSSDFKRFVHLTFWVGTEEPVSRRFAASYERWHGNIVRNYLNHGRERFVAAIERCCGFDENRRLCPGGANMATARAGVRWECAGAVLAVDTGSASLALAGREPLVTGDLTALSSGLDTLVACTFQAMPFRLVIAGPGQREIVLATENGSPAIYQEGRRATLSPAVLEDLNVWLAHAAGSARSWPAPDGITGTHATVAGGELRLHVSEKDHSQVITLPLAACERFCADLRKAATGIKSNSLDESDFALDDPAGGRVYRVTRFNDPYYTVDNCKTGSSSVCLCVGRANLAIMADTIERAIT